MFAATVARSLLGLLLPPRCTCCGEPADSAGGAITLRSACRRELAALAGQPSCPRCGRTVGPYASCSLCARKTPPFQAAVRIGIYDGPLSRMVQSLKYKGARHGIPLLSELLAAKLHQAGAAQEVDLVTAVPLHWWRYWRRGFNQSLLLARGLRRRGLEAPQRRVLVRTRDTRPQVGLSMTARRENVRGAFRVRRPAEVKGRRILLVDDVMTTGATAGECARVLRRAGARSVTVAVVAVAGPSAKPMASQRVFG